MAHFPWDIVVWAVVAVIAGSAVFFVLGRRIGAQAIRQEQSPVKRDPRGEQARGTQAGDAPKPPPLPGRVGPEQKATEYGLPARDSQLGQTLAQVGQCINGFSETFFLKRAEDIFGRTVKAFASADKAELERTLAPTPFAAFSQALEERAERHERVHLDLRRIERLDYISAERVIDGETTTYRLGVKIVSWQVNYCQDEKDVLIEGTEALTEFRDYWVFEYDHGGLWKVVSTAAD